MSDINTERESVIDLHILWVFVFYASWISFAFCIREAVTIKI